MIKDDCVYITSYGYNIVNGEIILSKKPRVAKIPINDILVANGFEPIKENNNVRNNRHKPKILSKYINIMN